MTILDEPMMLIRGIARLANCEELPSVRIVFDNPRDQAAFKCEIVKRLDPQPDGGPRCFSKGNIDTFDINGLQIDLSNTERGTRAAVNKLIKVARKALDDANGSRVTATEIIALRESLAALLDLVGG